jgi:dolichol-phosphate mannosyltransferase
MHRFIPTLIRLTGGEVVEVPVSHRPRRSGESKYTAWNRALPALRDAVGVRWLRRRALRYTVTREIG